MTDQELEVLLNDVESDRAERKASDSAQDKIRQAICAFANNDDERRLSEKRRFRNIPFDLRTFEEKLTSVRFATPDNPPPEFQPEDSHLLVTVRRGA
jgi:hypothetical protein